MILEKCNICKKAHRGRYKSFDIYLLEKGVHSINVCHECILKFPKDLSKKLTVVNGLQNPDLNSIVFMALKNLKHRKRNYDLGYTIIICDPPSLENYRSEKSLLDRLIGLRNKGVDVYAIYYKGCQFNQEKINSMFKKRIVPLNIKAGKKDQSGIILDKEINYIV